MKEALKILPSDEQVMDTAARIAKAIQDRMAPAGSLGLPPLLEARRQRYGIPNEAFEVHALYDRILLWQIEPKEQEGKNTYGGGMIILPETAQRRVREECPRGVIVTAGLQALDHLRSNGVDLGHIVSFVRLSPWRKPIATFDGHAQHLLVMRSGDLIDSEDLQEMLKANALTVARSPEGQHQIAGYGAAQMPFVDESY